MYLTQREKKIMMLLLNQPKGILIDYIRNQLKVSERTVYRDMKSLEDVLANYRIKISNDSKRGYFLKGSLENLHQLQKELDLNWSEELTTQQRQSLLIIELLTAEEEIKTEALANQYKVGISTIQLDLQAIEETLKAYHIEIQRKKGRGISARGTESDIRLVISGLVNMEIDEYNFFQIVDEKKSLQNNPFFQYIQPWDMKVAYDIITQVAADYFLHVTDVRLKRITTFIAVTLWRLKEGKSIFTLSQNNSIIQDERVLEIAKIIFEKIQQTTRTEYNEKEVAFIAFQIQGLNLPVNTADFLEGFESSLAYHVHELIRLVSDELSWNFNQDDTLFKDLLSHIGAAINRTYVPMPEGHEVFLDKIFKQYDALGSTVEKALKVVFPTVRFSKNEIVYIIVHFASAAEKVPRIHQLSALLICSSGVGTTKILETRIRRYIPEIHDVTTSSISKLHELELGNFDLILSTTFLQGFEHDYKVVTPLLMEDEIIGIREKVKTLIPPDQAVFEPLKGKSRGDIPSRGDQDFMEYYQLFQTAKFVLTNFEVSKMEEESSIQAYLEAICRRLQGTILADPMVVQKQLLERMHLAPIGLPQTGIGFFHCLSEEVKNPFFGIYDLAKSVPILDINKDSMELKRVLLMLAPEDIDSSTKEILGAISASMVESNLNLEIFNLGTKENIEKLLNNLFVNIIKKYS